MFLLIGGDSEIGAATARHLRCRGHIVSATTRRPERAGPDRPFFDLAAPLECWEPPLGTTAVGIFAGIDRIAACEADPAGSAFINVEQTLTAIDRLLERDIQVVFLSTNRVFDGTHPHVAPQASTCPVGEYGRQKARAEAALGERAAAGLPVAILRLAKVVSPDMPLLRGWVAALRSGQPVRAFYDMAMAPVPVEAVMQAIEALSGDRATGIFQLSGPRDITYADIARQLVKRAGADEGLIELVSARSAGLPAFAAPPHTTLDSTRMRESYGLVVPDALDVLEPAFSAALKRTPGG